MNSRRRLTKELADMKRNPDKDIQLVPACGDSSDVTRWQLELRGPQDSPYEGGVFQLKMHCGEKYPMEPPRVQFVTRVFHPNVHNDGSICLDILQNDWSPAWNLMYVARAIGALLAHPNADSPLNCDAGNLIREGDVDGFESMAKMYTLEYAIVEGIANTPRR